MSLLGNNPIVNLVCWQYCILLKDNRTFTPFFLEFFMRTCPYPFEWIAEDYICIRHRQHGNEMIDHKTELNKSNQRFLAPNFVNSSAINDTARNPVTTADSCAQGIRWRTGEAGCVRPQRELPFPGRDSDFPKYGHGGCRSAVVSVALKTDTILVDCRLQPGKLGVCENGHKERQNREVDYKKDHKDKDCVSLAALPKT
jgi:hypothetical protein